ncbi:MULTISPECIES: HesB/IscA family protein [Solibacillus]|uniref:Iron-sulfur cluster assembly accessory protein n=1 Tax=Solibacillus palustris TaxID=2908203 RepID=A0ABS9UFB3_9BACL|nr:MULTISPECIES: iron-sulfur cluster assembly accessory protein [Solibacillus]MCH7323027.1 iron-sulfur cluster assembly accessory protein [Solibacillus sp. MA9]
MAIEKQVVILTEAASFQVKEMMAHNEEEHASLRVAVKGGGCSGLSYGMAFDNDVNEDDFTDNQFGIRILVSKDDAGILQGTKIDFKQSLMGGGFTIDNPNALASCGCGTSFKAAARPAEPQSCE